MARKKKPIRTDIGWSNASSITLFGRDFPSEILGHLNLGDMGFLELTARLRVLSLGPQVDGHGPTMTSRVIGRSRMRTIRLTAAR